MQSVGKGGGDRSIYNSRNNMAYDIAIIMYKKKTDQNHVGCRLLWFIIPVVIERRTPDRTASVKLWNAAASSANTTTVATIESTKMHDCIEAPRMAASGITAYALRLSVA